MKKVLLAALLVLVGVQGMDAHQRTDRKPKSAEKRIEKIMDKMDERLELSDKQEQDIKTLLTDFYQRGDRKKDREGREAEMEQLDQQIKAVLNDNQKVQFDKMKMNKKIRKCDKK